MAIRASTSFVLTQKKKKRPKKYKSLEANNRYFSYRKGAFDCLETKRENTKGAWSFDAIQDRNYNINWAIAY